MVLKKNQPMAGRFRTCGRITLNSVALLLLFAANFPGGVREAESCDLLDQYNDYPVQDFNASTVEYSSSGGSEEDCLNLCNSNCSCVACMAYTSYFPGGSSSTCNTYTSISRGVLKKPDSGGRNFGFYGFTLHIRKVASCALTNNYTAYKSAGYDFAKVADKSFESNNVLRCQINCDSDCSCVAYSFYAMEPKKCLIYYSTEGSISPYTNASLYLRQSNSTAPSPPSLSSPPTPPSPPPPHPSPPSLSPPPPSLSRPPPSGNSSSPLSNPPPPYMFPPPPDRSSGSGSTIPIIGGVVGGAVVLVIVGGLIFYFLSRGKPPSGPLVAVTDTPKPIVYPAVA